MKEEVYARIIDPNNHEKVIEWAKGICRGATIDEAASGLKVDATIEAVVENLTASLPSEIRQQAARVCESEFTRFEDQRLEIAKAIAGSVDPSAVESSPILLEGYGIAASEILRSAMVPVDERELAAVIRRTTEHLGGRRISDEASDRMTARILRLISSG